VGIPPDTGTTLSDGIAAQTADAIGNLAAALRAAGAGLGDVVAVTVYLSDMSDYEAMNAEYGKRFPDGGWPTRTTVGVAALPRGARIEITAVAWKPRS
jgi:2-iminobutanoate/2-iminopropanoate deaminase